MKLWSNYKKEMKIASRGFYFYVEIVVAVVLLAVLLIFVPEQPASSVKEVIFMDMPAPQRQILLEKSVEQGRKEAGTEEIKLKAAEITYYDEETGEAFHREYPDKKTITLPVYEAYDEETGRVAKTLYIADNFDDMLRLADGKNYVGAVMWYDGEGKDHYQAVLTGNETQRYKNLVTAAYGTSDLQELADVMETQNVRLLQSPQQLGLRQSIIPLAVVMLNGMMGMMLVIAYISVDKAEGIIKAMAVSPIQINHYFLSKVLVVATIALASSLVVAVPVMGTQPQYPLFILSVLCMTLFSCALGLLVSSFFKDVKASFGVLIILMLVMMLPAFTYLLPAFFPAWVKFLPSYYMLEGLKESLLANTDVLFVLLSCGGMLAVGGALFAIASHRYKKVLGI